MTRQVQRDPVLDQLTEAREDLAVILSLAENAEEPDVARIADLRRRQKTVEAQISLHRRPIG